MTGWPEMPHQGSDLTVLWEWEYDRDFIELLGRRCRQSHLTMTSTGGPHPTSETCASGQTGLPALVLDRASDRYPELIPVLGTLKEQGVRVVNDAARMVWARDKATMHLELVAAGVSVPYAVIVSSEDRPNVETLHTEEHRALGTPFVIKPANGGGGEGVVLDARDKADVVSYLDATGYDKVLLQHLVEPRTVAGRRGWFRVFHIDGTIIPCWWNDLTHEYCQLDPADETAEGLGPLREITSLIARISQMDLFTTEIALDREGRFVVVDFVNEMPDLRPQSSFKDGVPDPILELIADTLVTLALAATRSPQGRRDVQHSTCALP